MRGKNRSSAKRVAPVTFAVASTLRSGLPTPRNAIPLPSFRRSVVFFLRLPIQRLRCRLGLLASHMRRRQLNGLVDLYVAGAAAQVPGEGLLDVVARGGRVGGEERLGREQ